MKFKITLTDDDGGFIDIEVEAINWSAAIDIAEDKHKGWTAIQIDELETVK